MFISVSLVTEAQFVWFNACLRLSVFISFISRFLTGLGFSLFLFICLIVVQGI